MTLRADALRNRERLLDVARQELAGGNVALQLNDIARKAGVGVGTVYRHFPTPQALLEALVGEQLNQLVEIARQALAMADIQAAFTFMLRSTFDMLLCTDGGLSVVMLAIEDADCGTTRAKDELGVLTAELLRRAHEAGVVRRDLTAADVRNLVCGVEHAVRTWPDGDQNRSARYLDVLIQGLRQSG
ncbi:AcrR family transcriptional regulator [Kibdelosporangium banguiense]|uniref:AcrR family transcriptional regulator n=1 Tax=Kibdelosporangium banguiense TaxID=1365924 RepID=A0ABS4TIY3_9PSEU|nr:TetR/AcrR family transcriptional regulator [Kibdelosporangium banguiense]MBP2324385.1 AcrR family transcriptional regulator [Kibdelosporangium banguiense]